MSVPHPWLAGFGITALRLALSTTSGLAPMSAGWFGQAGASALSFAREAQNPTGLTLPRPLCSLAVTAPAVAPGLAGTHLSALLGARLGRQVAP